MKRTSMLLPPTMEEVKLQAAKIGLPDREAQKFFNYYESIGWRVGRAGHRMASFTHAMAGWKLNWEERNRGVNGVPISTNWDKLEREIDRL